MTRGAVLTLFLAVALPAAALETAQWPPPDPVASRMKALQQALQDPKSTAPEREAAREELASLLKSPAGKARGRTADEKPPRPARAAIDPLPSAVKPANIAPPAPPPAGVARLEIVEPPRPVFDPRSGMVTTPPAGQFAVDPRTGNVLHGTPGGFIDPKTGQIVR